MKNVKAFNDKVNKTTLGILQLVAAVAQKI